MLLHEQTLVVALGAGLGISQGTPSVWGAINLLEGRGSPVATSALTSAEAPTEPAGETGNDNPGAKSRGMKQLVAINKMLSVTKSVHPT